jgi:uncharacterized protein YndB with AHSA1/START domain
LFQSSEAAELPYRTLAIVQAKGAESLMETKTIVKEQFIKAAPERVFKALTEKRELERWFVHEAEIELKPGGTIRREFAPGMGVARSCAARSISVEGAEEAPAETA